MKGKGIAIVVRSRWAVLGIVGAAAVLVVGAGGETAEATGYCPATERW
jgi:hypothetical protein